mmetsp:Transcript_31514/g.73759  ORF Transcript_31514/g.73759 Transcript_31514/m.73759 type:complete len:162 (-) Transcript_31514:134-619(-)
MFGLLQGGGWWVILSKIKSSFPKAEQISTSDLDQALRTNRDGVIILDVRAKEEYDVSHLEGALWVGNDGELADEVLSQHMTPEKTMVACYCSVGYRSSTLAERLKQERNAPDGLFVNVEKSIFGWANDGKPVYKDGKQVPLVHPYNSTWGLLLKKELRSPI